MSIFSFGTYTENVRYKVLDERRMRASAGIMFLLGLIAFINGFILQNFDVIPFISGFLLINFLIGIFINPKLSPTVALASVIVRKQNPLPVGAVQKKFAWTLGLILTSIIFILSLLLLEDIKFFEPVCMLCIICLVILYLETAFGICMGCKLYHTFIKIGILKEPEVKPNCMGDSCTVD